MSQHEKPPVASINTRRVTHEELKDAQELADAFARAYGDADSILARLREQMEPARG